jgi:hypothetical protein
MMTRVERHDGVYREQGADDRELDRYLVLCALPDAPAGEYDVEVTVEARDEEHAASVAEAAIWLDYNLGLTPRVVAKQ